MIVLLKEDLHDQAGMEHAFRWYFDNVGDDPQCRGTFNTMLNARFHSCSYEKSELVLAFRGQPWMGNPSGILHGGVTASTLDMAMGLLCRYCSGGYMTPTIDMSVSYLRPGPIDRTFYARAVVTKTGLNICHASSVLWAEGAPDRFLASASGSYYVTHRRDA